jgi:hypothetical protein
MILTTITHREEHTHYFRDFGISLLVLLVETCVYAIRRSKSKLDNLSILDLNLLVNIWWADGGHHLKKIMGYLKHALMGELSNFHLGVVMHYATKQMKVLMKVKSEL